MGFIDLQVNGCFGVDFNQDDLGADDLHRACEGLIQDGVEKILATIITERLDKMEQRLRRIVQLRGQDELIGRVVSGLHIEGPFLYEAEGYRGAHPLDAIVPADADAAQRLLDAAGGLTRIFTLSPERDPGMQVTRMLAGRGITVSAGHCDTSLEILDEAIDAGLSMFTHLGNGCPMHLHRHDNVVQRALARSDRLHLGFIADGAHVSFPALGNYLRLAGIDRCFVVTDAMAAAGLGPGRYKIGRWDLQIGEDLVARAPDGSHLVGSAVSMQRAHENLMRHAGVSEADAQRLTAKNPARFL